VNRRLAALLLALACAGCTRVGSNGKTAAGLNPWTRPNVLTISAASDPKNLDPVLASSEPTLELSAFLFSYTVRYDDRSRPVADAVREIPTVENGDVSRDGLTLRYKLRSDILFHDGVPLTCDDLKFTWQVVMNPHNNAVTTDGYKDIRDIDCRDPHEAVVHMKRIYAPFLQQLWSVNGNAPILPKHLLERYNDDKGSFNNAPYQSAPVGSGPYTFVSWERGSDVRMRAFPQYFRGKPAIDEVVYRIVPDENTLATLAVTHEIDLLFHGTGAIWQRIRAIPGTIAITPPVYTYDHVDFNLRRPIFADRRVREALKLAIDRPSMLEKVQHGLGELAETDQSPSLGIAYDPTVRRTPYDPKRAAALLDAAGWKMGPGGVRVRGGVPLAFTLSTQTESDTGKSIETLVQAYWSAVGARVTIKNAPTSSFFDNTANGIVQGGHYDSAIFAWSSAPDPDDSAIYSGDNFAPHGQNALFWNDRVATAAMNDALATVDMPRRIADYHIVQHRLADEVPTIVLWFRHEPQVYNDDLKNFTATPAITTPFWNPWTYRY
jgi:peptide/nickel transport system substrate-binding protein